MNSKCFYNHPRPTYKSENRSESSEIKNKILVLNVFGLLLLSFIFGNLFVNMGYVPDNSNASSNQISNIASQNFIPKPLSRFADFDNSYDNATELLGAGPTTISGNLSGDAAAGDDYLDFYKIDLDNYFANADNIKLDCNTTSPYMVIFLLFDPDYHLLATSITLAGFNGSIELVAQSAGFHYIGVAINPMDGYADYNLTYETKNVVNSKFFNDNDFVNATDVGFSVQDMGFWIKKSYSNSDELNQTLDIHDFYNLTINASDNITVTLDFDNNNTFGIELFNGSNASRKLAHEEFFGSDTNKTVYYDVNYTGRYYIRIYSAYTDPFTFGGTGNYNLSIMIKPQNSAPEVLLGAPTIIVMDEDDPPETVLLNESVFYDNDIGNTSDYLTFYILNGSTWDTSYVSANLSVGIGINGNTSISPQPDTNTTGELLIFKVVDWLGFNVTHTINVIVNPLNDGPKIEFINSIPITSHYLDLTAWEDQTFTLTVNASDKEGNIIEFKHQSTKNFQQSMAFNDPYIRNYTFTPDNSMVGIVQINVTINETYDYVIPGDWVLINIAVNNSNDKPTITKVDDIIYAEGSTVEFLKTKGVFTGDTIVFSITAVDVDVPHGDVLTFNSTNFQLLQRGVLKITELGVGGTIVENIANISFTPETFDIGIQDINITVRDSEKEVSNIVLRVEVRDARYQYSLVEDNITFDYSEIREEDDYTFYELVYQQPETQSLYRIMAHTRKGAEISVDIVGLKSRKLGNYMNITIDTLGTITKDTVIRLYFVNPSKHQEPELDINSQSLPAPYTPENSSIYFSMNYNDPAFQLPIDIAPPVLEDNSKLVYSIHLGVLENDYGIGYGVDFDIFAQAFQLVRGSGDYDYFAYDSIGAGSADAPGSTVSYLLRDIQLRFDEPDSADDDVYGYSMKFKTPDRSVGVSLESTERGGNSEIDILRLEGRRKGVFFDVKMVLAGKVSNNSRVTYSVYIVKMNHNETGVHLTPTKLADDDYPVPYKPDSNTYYHLAEYNNGTIILADNVAIDNNQLTFSFNLCRLQHPSLIGLTSTSEFHIFAVAVIASNSSSAIEYGFHYDTVGFGAKPAPTLVLKPEENGQTEDSDSDNILNILGEIAGIPILILIIIAIIIICIIAAYATRLKSKYGGGVDVDVPPVPPVPSPRGGKPPVYGVYPGRARDERYYNSLYKDEMETGYDDYAYRATAQRQAQQKRYDIYEEGPLEGELPVSAMVPEYEEEEIPLEAETEEPTVESEEEAAEALTEDELDLLVSPEELITEEVEEELKELEQTEPTDELEGEEIEETEVEDSKDFEVEELSEAEEEMELEEGELQVHLPPEEPLVTEPPKGTDEEFEIEEGDSEGEEESEPLDDVEPVEDNEPVSEDEPIDEIEPVEEDDEPVEDIEPMDEDATEEVTEAEAEESSEVQEEDDYEFEIDVEAKSKSKSKQKAESEAEIEEVEEDEPNEQSEAEEGDETDNETDNETDDESDDEEYDEEFVPDDD
jgi:hypothetical protein